MPVDEYLSEAMWPSPGPGLEAYVTTAVGKFVGRVRVTRILDKIHLKRRDS
jgi:hypothetical protein